MQRIAAIGAGRNWLDLIRPVEARVH